MDHKGVWRIPDEESEDLYPGLVVHDGRVTGSLTIGPSRLPVWAVIAHLCRGGWDYVLEGWPYVEEDYDFGERDINRFLYNLTNLRGEFARLLAVLAGAEYQEDERRNNQWEQHCEEVHPDEDSVICECGVPDPPAWWNDLELATPVIEQLDRCSEILKANVNYQDEDLPL